MSKRGGYNKLDLIGKQFSYLTVLAEYGCTNAGKVKWLCRCDCGKLTTAISSELRSNHKKSCGCKRGEMIKDARTRHGLSQSNIRSKWKNMLRRCKNQNCAEYKNYGGRGISVAKEWDDLKTFAKWAYANGYQEGSSLTLDRIDVNGDYTPSNCRWVSMKVQGNNKRNNRVIKYKNQNYTLQQLADEFGINRTTLAYRLNHGMEVEAALGGGK